MDKIELVNKVPKFLDFYQKASHDDIDPDKRWELWEEHYRFAAVPPGEEGKKLARKLLDEAWPGYQEKLNYIQQWSPNQELLEKLLMKIKGLLGLDEAINLVVVYFVGGFENNPFVTPYDAERLAVCLPIENGDSEILLSHELTHIVHAKTGNLKILWERSIASMILQEGLALQVSKWANPGYSDESYIEMKLDGWFASCTAHKEEILKGIIPYLNDSSYEAVMKFTFGSGTTNHQREAYFVGWEIVHYLLENGISFNDIAHINEQDMPDYIAECISNILNFNIS